MAQLILGIFATVVTTEVVLIRRLPNENDFHVIFSDDFCKMPHIESKVSNQVDNFPCPFSAQQID